MTIILYNNGISYGANDQTVFILFSQSLVRRPIGWAFPFWATYEESTFQGFKLGPYKNTTKIGYVCMYIYISIYLCVDAGSPKGKKSARSWYFEKSSQGWIVPRGFQDSPNGTSKWINNHQWFPVNLMGKSMVSCKFSLEPIHWISGWWF